jgi:hypothetical protein
MMRVQYTLAILALSLLFPALSYAAPFGGAAGIVIPCYNNAIYASVGAPVGGQYIWTPATATYRFGPPTHAGQWLLGLSGAPYYCIVSILPVIVFPGIAIMMMGSSQ